MDHSFSEDIVCPTKCFIIVILTIANHSKEFTVFISWTCYYLYVYFGVTFFVALNQVSTKRSFI